MGRPSGRFGSFTPTTEASGIDWFSISTATGVVALASGFSAAGYAIFLGFSQIGPVRIDKKRPLAGESSDFSARKHQIPCVFLMLGRPHPSNSKKTQSKPRIASK